MTKRAEYEWAPGDPKPRRGNRNLTARIVSLECFPITPKALENWPVSVTIVGGQRLYDIAEVLEHCRKILLRAPRYKQAAAPSRHHIRAIGKGKAPDECAAPDPVQ